MIIITLENHLKIWKKKTKKITLTTRLRIPIMEVVIDPKMLLLGQAVAEREREKSKIEEYRSTHNTKNK